MEIVRGNAWSTMLGASAPFLDRVARHLSVQVELGVAAGTRFSVIWQHEGLLYGSLVHGNRVAAGLTPHIQKLADYYREPWTYRDARKRPEDAIPYWSVTSEWRPYQDAIHRALVASDGCGIVDAVPRSGKTRMAARIIDALGHPALYLAPSVQIVQQTYNVLVGYFGHEFVGRLDGEATHEERVLTRPIVVATSQSAVKQPKEFFDSRHVLVLDESHHLAAQTFHTINQLAENIYYRFGFTGTNFRTGDDELAMEAVCSTVLARITIDDLIPNFLAEPRVLFIPVRAPRVEGDWASVYQQGIVDCEERNNLVVQTANMLIENGIPTIVLTRRRAHADYLGTKIADSIVVKGGANVLTGNSVRDFLAGRHAVIIGTTVIGEGVDLPRASALVFASGGAEGVTMMQSYFRPLTAHAGKDVARIYDFYDTHNRLLRRHSEQRITMAREQLGNHRVVTPR